MRSLAQVKPFVRGARLDTVLHRGGRAFQQSAGCSASFALSQEVDYLDAFLSHTWSTPRWKKFMALCLHYNATVAFSAAFLVGLILSLGTASHVLPLVELPQPFKRNPSFSPYATVVVPVMFHVVCHCANEVWPIRSRIFVDKLCIHQTDDEKKQEGIAHLALTMFFSSEMVVLQSDVYFDRLWTTYEMASRLVVDGGRGIVILPVNLPSFVLGSSAAVTIALVIFFLLTNTQSKGLLPILQHLPVAVQIFIVLLPLYAAAIVIFRMWSREQATRKNRVQNFSIRNVACTDERDRKPVYANIVNLLEDADHLAGTSPDQALDVFDRLAREKMPQAMDTSGLRLFHCWVIGLAYLGRALDLLAVDIMARATARSAALRFCRSASQCIFLLPELMWFCDSSTKRCLHLTGVAQAMYLLMVATVAVLLTMLWDFMNFWLMYEAEEKDVMVGVYVAVMALQALLVPALFRGPRRRASRRHRISCAESMQAVQRFRFGIDFTFGHGTQPATPPSISEEEPAPLPLPSIECAAGIWRDAADEESTPSPSVKRVHL